MDVDINARFIDDLTYDLAARSNDITDLLNVDGDGLYARCVRREFLCRFVNAFEHLPENERTSLLCLCQRRCKNVPCNPGNLNVHLNCCNPLGCASNLEVHVSESILHSLNIRQD